MDRFASMEVGSPFAVVGVQNLAAALGVIA
jgi:hypothetical protein